MAQTPAGRLMSLAVELSNAANDSERAEVAGRVVDLDGHYDSADLTDMEVIAAAKRIITQLRATFGSPGGV
jgi:hypothetical protein